MAKKIHYGWIILFLSFLGLLSVQGPRTTFGAFLHPWEVEFSVNRANMSLIAMISFIVYGVSQPIMGKLIDKWGVHVVLAGSTLLVGLSTMLTFFATSIWHIALFYGVISAIGFGGASGVAATVAVTNWFQEKRGLALGIITAGSSAGQLVLVPLALLLINRVGWQMTTLLIGLFLTVVVFPSLLLFLRSFPIEKGLNPYGATKPVQLNSHLPLPEQSQPMAFHNIKNKMFWFLAIPYFICGYTTTGLMDIHLISYTNAHGHSVATTGTAVSLLAGFNIVGTLASGYIADYWSNRKFLALLYSIRAVSILLLFVSDHYYSLWMFAIFFGLVDFATVTPTSVLAAAYFENFPVGYVLGLLSLSH